VHGDGYQIVLTDTPGFHKPRTLLGRRLNELVSDSTTDVDVVVLVVDGAAGVGRGDAFVAARQVEPLACPTLCVVNKVDRLSKARIVEQLAAAAALADFEHVFPVSAKQGAGLESLLEVLVEAVPEGPAYFPDGEATDQAIEHRIGEIVREKALAIAREEVPHSIATQVEEIVREEGLVRIDCVLLVERDSQKGIVIGKGGEMIKRIGTRAREELETLLGEKVFLELRVKVQKEWQRDPKALERLGY
jgi:GTP-binding protein Era